MSIYSLIKTLDTFLRCTFHLFIFLYIKQKLLLGNITHCGRSNALTHATDRNVIQVRPNTASSVNAMTTMTTSASTMIIMTGFYIFGNLYICNAREYYITDNHECITGTNFIRTQKMKGKAYVDWKRKGTEIKWYKSASISIPSFQLGISKRSNKFLSKLHPIKSTSELHSCFSF